MRAILYTRHDGGVSVCTPSANCIRWMATGGRWADRPRGYVDIQIERQIEAGHHRDAAARFARALAFGGVTEREAYEIIRDRDCGHLGSAHDLINSDELPDRWFRNAWTRSHNGGPVGISVAKARPIQWARILKAVKAENAAREESYDPRPELRVDWGVIRSSIARAPDADDLRRIWPGGLDG
jgi:hypothetical protein